MTPKEKADQLVTDFKNITENSGLNALFDYSDYKKTAVKCATMSVDKIISELGILHKPEYIIFQERDNDGEWYNGYSRSTYWEEVKKEIENL